MAVPQEHAHDGKHEDCCADKCCPIPGNRAYSSTLYTHPAWPLGLKRVTNDTTDGPGPAFLADEYSPWDRRSYKFGNPRVDGPAKVRGPYYNFPNDTIEGNKKTIGGWRPARSARQEFTPGPADYHPFRSANSFRMKPSWGDPPATVRPDLVKCPYPKQTFAPRPRPSTVPVVHSKRFPDIKVTPGPADYSPKCMCCKQKGISMGRKLNDGRYDSHRTDKKTQNIPGPKHPIEQSTIGAATRRGWVCGTPKQGGCRCKC